MSNTINIYWTNLTSSYLVTRQALALGDWKPFLPNYIEKNNDEYFKCKSFHEVFKNTFYIEHPHNLTVDFDADPNVSGAIRVRDTGNPDTITFDYDLKWLFFSEEPVIIEVTPAYMHNNTDSMDGHITTGSMDISKWFRPVVATYRMWAGRRKIEFKKGEPMFYVHFKTDKKINLIRFEQTDKVVEIMDGCVSLKNVMPNLPLSDLYNRFIRSKRDKVLLKEIKANLLN